MKVKQKNNKFVHTFNKNLVASLFYENALVFSKVIKQAKKHNLFEKKIRYIKARIVAKNSFGFEKRNHNFQTHIINKDKKKMPKLSVIYNLMLLSLKVKNLGNKLLTGFATKFVGKEAQALVNNFLNTYAFMYRSWYENEKWGFFDEDLTEKTKLKLMKYFWLNKSRRFLKSRLWTRAYQHNRSGFRYVKKFGYNLRSLKFTDQLFFWHAFTRKKLKQTLWVSRTCQIFRRILYLRKKKLIVKNFTQNELIFDFCNFIFYKSFVNNSLFCFAANFHLKVLNQVQGFYVTTQKINQNFEFLINQSYKIQWIFLLFKFSGKFCASVSKNIVLILYILFSLNFFKKIPMKTKISNLYTNMSVAQFFYTKNNFINY